MLYMPDIPESFGHRPGNAMGSRNEVDAETFGFRGTYPGGVQDAWIAFDFCAADLRL
jgi:hypothetical protein